MITVFCISSTLMFLFLGTIWKNDSLLNLSLRIAYFTLTIFGVICSLSLLGFVVHG